MLGVAFFSKTWGHVYPGVRSLDSWTRGTFCWRKSCLWLFFQTKVQFLKRIPRIRKTFQPQNHCRLLQFTGRQTIFCLLNYIAKKFWKLRHLASVANSNWKGFSLVAEKHLQVKWRSSKVIRVDWSCWSMGLSVPLLRYAAISLANFCNSCL